MSLVDTAMKYYNMMENMRDRERRDVQFSYQLSQWEHGERKMAFEAAEMDFADRTRTDREELRRQEINTGLGAQKAKQLELYTEKRKSIQAIVEAHEGDPEIYAWADEQTKQMKAGLMKTMPQYAAVVADTSISQEDMNRFMSESETSIREESGKRGLNKTQTDQLLENLVRTRLGATGKFEELAKMTPSDAIFAKVVMGPDYQPTEEVLTLDDTDNQRVAQVQGRATQIWEELGNEDMSLLEKRVFAVKQASDETLTGVEPNKRFAIIQSVAAGMDTHIAAESQKAMNTFDSKAVEKWSNAALAMAEFGVEKFATLAPEAMLQELGVADHFSAFQELTKAENSGKMHHEMRTRLAAAAGGDIYNAVKQGHIDENSADFKRDVMLATVRITARNAAMQPDVDGVAVYKALQQLESDIMTGKTSGEGAVWAMLGSVFDRIQRSVPEIREQMLNWKPDAQRRNAIAASDGRAYAHDGANYKNDIAVPVTPYTSELLKEHDDRYVLPNTVKERDIKNQNVGTEVFRQAWDFESPALYAVMADPERAAGNMARILDGHMQNERMTRSSRLERAGRNTFGWIPGIDRTATKYDNPEVVRTREFYTEMESGNYEVFTEGSPRKRWGGPLTQDEVSGREGEASIRFRGKWKGLVGNLNREQLTAFHGNMMAMQNAREGWAAASAAGDRDKMDEFGVQFMLSKQRAMQIGGFSFEALGAREIVRNTAGAQ